MRRAFSTMRLQRVLSVLCGAMIATSMIIPFDAREGHVLFGWSSGFMVAVAGLFNTLVYMYGAIVEFGDMNQLALDFILINLQLPCIILAYFIVRKIYLGVIVSKFQIAIFLLMFATTLHVTPLAFAGDTIRIDGIGVWAWGSGCVALAMLSLYQAAINCGGFKGLDDFN